MSKSEHKPLASAVGSVSSCAFGVRAMRHPSCVESTISSLGEVSISEDCTSCEQQLRD
jgi:hypothetical protein